MLIAGNEPDLILIAEVIPKARLVYMSPSRLYIPGYTCYSNFDPDSNQFTGLRGICIYVSNNLHSSEVHFTSEFEEHLWIRIKFNSSQSLLVGCVYRSPSSNLENSTNSLCQLLRQVISSSSRLLIIAISIGTAYV